jgi:hypothetical protein
VGGALAYNLIVKQGEAKVWSFILGGQNVSLCIAIPVFDLGSM